MKKTPFINLFSMLLISFFLLTFVGQSLAAGNLDAPREQGAAKVVFDVKKEDPEQLLRALNAIINVRDNLVRQGMQPDMIVSFRGPTVTCLLDAAEDPQLDEYQEDVLDKISWNIIELKKAGVKMEICSLALKLAGIEDEVIQSGINKVDNSLVSLITYQNKGYALIAI
jgi:intracellular sulfur oxidation DsrE/DsrF family protein